MMRTGPPGISTERAQFIADLANDEWIDRLENEVSSTDFDRLSEEWDRRTEEFLATVTNPAELHLLADLWNWDCGALTTMSQAVSLPICERATALLIFWRAQPEDFQCYGSADEVPEHMRETYEFVREIERLYLDDAFAEGSLRYDPRTDYNLAGPTVADFSIKWKISSLMYEPVRE